MAENTVDTLKLQIESDAQRASNQLDKLSASLLGLNKAVGRGQSGLLKFSSDLTNFSRSIQSLDSLKNLNLQSTISQLTSLSKINLNNLTNKKIELDFDIKGGDKAGQIQYAIEKAISETKVDTSSLTNQIVESFNLDKAAGEKIKSQLDGIANEMAASFDGVKIHTPASVQNTFEEMANTIIENGKVVRSNVNAELGGVMQEYQDFYNFFNSHKIYISDYLKADIGSNEFSALLQSNLRNVVRDATKGIDLNASWGELTERFPSLLSKDTINAADQIIEVLEQIKRVRDEIKPISISELTGNMKSTAVDNVWESVMGSGNELYKIVNENIKNAIKAADEKINLDLDINEDKIVSDIKRAINKASSIEYDPVKIRLKANVSEIKRVLSDELGDINFGNDVSGLPTLAKGLSELANAAVKFSNVKTGDITKVTKAIEKLSQINYDNLKVEGDFSNIASLFHGFDGFTDLAQKLSALDPKQINSSISVLRRISALDFSAFSSGLQSLQGGALSVLSDLGSAFQAFAGSLKNTEGIDSGVQKIFSSLARMAQYAGNIPAITVALPGLSDAIRRFVDEIAKASVVDAGTVSLVTALSGIASAGEKVAKSAASLSGITAGVREFIDALSKAPQLNDNVIKAVQSLSQLAGAGGKAGSAARSLQGNINSLSNSMKGLKTSALKPINGIKSLARQLLSAAGVAGIFYTAFNAVKKSINIASDLVEVQNVVDVTFGDMRQKVEDMADVSIADFGMSELTVKKIASRYQAMGSAMGFSTEKMSDMSIELTKLAADMASFYNVSQESVAEDLESIFTGQTRPLRQYGLDLTEATLGEWALRNGIEANFKSMSQQEKMLLRYQYVLANTGAAQGDFARTADSWHNTIVRLTQSFEQLGKIIGTSFINAFRPLIATLNTVMVKVIEFAETVSNALGAIFGWKIEINSGGLLQDADLAEELANGMGDAAAGADDLKKKLSVLPFDQLNQLASNMSDSGSGSGGGISGGATGEGTEAKLVKTETIFEDYKSDIDSLYELGDYIGEVLTNVMNGINWDSIYEKARNFGSGLANFLNGLISPDLFGAVGRTIAGALNTAIYSAVSFGETFDWSGFGGSISEGINEFFETFDFATFADMIDAWVQGIWEAIKGAIGGLNWETVWEGVKEFLGNLDIETIEIILGALVIKKIISANIISSALGFVGSKISNLIANAIGSKLGLELAENAGIGGAIKEIIKNFSANLPIDKIAGIGTVLAGTITSISNFFEMWKNGFDWLNEALMVVGIAVTAVGAVILGAPAAVAAVVAGIVAAVGTLAIVIHDNWDAIKNFFANIPEFWNENVLPFFKQLPEKFGNIVDSIVEFFSELPGKIGYAIGFVAGKVLVWSTELKQLFDEKVSAIVSGVVEFFKDLPEKIWNTIVSAKEKISEWAASLWEVLTTEIPKIVSGVVEFFKDLPENLYNIGKDVIQGLIDGITEMLTDIWNAITEFVDGFVEGFKDALGIHSPSTVFKDIGINIIDGLIEGIQSLIGSVGEVFGTIKETVVGKWEEIKSNTSEVWENVKSGVSEKWESIKSSASEKFSSVKNTISDSWSKVKSGTVETWGNIKSNVEQKWSGIKSSAVQKFSEIKSSVSEAWNSLKTNTSSVWNNVKSDVSSKFDNIKQVTSNASTYVKDNVSNAWNNLKGNASNIWSDMYTNLSGTMNSIKTFSQTFGENVKNTLTNNFTSIKSNISDIWSGMSSQLSTMMNSIKGNSQSFGENVKNTLTNSFNSLKSDLSNIWSGIQNSLSGVWSNLQSSASSIFSGISNTISNALSNINGIISNMQNTFGGIVNSAKNAAGNIVSAFNNISLPHIPTPHFSVSSSTHKVGSLSFSLPSVSVDWYKVGGLFQDAHVIGVGESGAEAVLPLESSKAMSKIADSILSNAPDTGYRAEDLRDAVAQGFALAMMNNSGNQQPISVHATITLPDGRVLTDVVLDEFDRMEDVRPGTIGRRLGLVN